MCGFLCLFGEKDSGIFDASLLQHRGPDATKVWESDLEEAPAKISHNRLSIIDLSENGAQPFFSDDERYVFVYNGEVYNYLELRADLEALGLTFKGDSDTEVLFKGFLFEGESFLHKCNGMWSFVIWDRVEKKATFAKDRFGKKPLFFYRYKHGIVFGSEMKALVPFVGELRPNKNIDHYFKDPFHYANSEESAIDGIYTCKAGYLGEWKDGTLDTKRWWCTLDNLVSVPERYNDQVKVLRDLLLDAIALRMRSDVPYGTALSGGLDSSVIFSAMEKIYQEEKAKYSFRPVAFTANYPGSSLDETEWARKLSVKIDAIQYNVLVDPANSKWGLRKSLVQVEDPYISLPIPMLNTYDKIRERGIKVTLDGHGADELLSGYGDIFLEKIFASRARISEISAIEKSLLSGNYDYKELGLVYANFLRILATLKALARNVRGFLWRDPSFVHPDRRHPAYKKMSLFNRRLYSIFHFSILPTLLRNYDRYSMANGVEVRMPFLDHRVVTFCFSLNAESKLGAGYTKRILRDAFCSITPSEILTRRDKTGWNAPLHEWLKGPLKGQIDELLIDTTQSTNSKEALAWKAFQNLREPTFVDGQKCWATIQKKIWLKFFNEN